MRKYENVDIVACLGAVLELNTEFHKGDFKYDTEMFKEAAKQPDGENNRLVWLSRHSGTECFKERDIYLTESYAHNSWTHFNDSRSETLLAYAAHIKGTENGRIKGDLYELDYREHAGHVKANALCVVAVSVTYADGTELHMPYKEWDGERMRLYHKHGEITSSRREPKDEAVLCGIIANARAEREKESRPAMFKVGIQNRHLDMSPPLAGESNVAPQYISKNQNYWEENTMAYKNAISASDPQAVEKLTEKLQGCEKLQETMKAVNAHWRRTGTCQGAPGITDAQADKLDAKVRNAAVSWERQPFSSYTLTNNNSEIKRLKARIAEISRNREVGFSGWEFYDGRAEANTELNRLQLFFDEKPNEAERALLKANGFKWAPSQGAWQRQLNDGAIYAAGRLNFLAPSDGRTVREHQPKAPERGGEAR
jgi:hypothetical protein